VNGKNTDCKAELAIFARPNGKPFNELLFDDDPGGIVQTDSFNKSNFFKRSRGLAAGIKCLDPIKS